MAQASRLVPGPVQVKFEFASASDTGRLRKNNEDSIVMDASSGVVVLADGMGGYNAGEVAAGMATSLISEDLGGWLRSHSELPGEEMIRTAMALSVGRANQMIFNAANDEPSYAGMGTTLVMLALAGGSAFIGHLGDSRAYRLRARRLEPLTRDHSLLQEQIDAGLITPEQAQRSVHRNLVTRALGVEPEVSLETHRHVLQEGDLLLLCSDGLTDMLQDEQIAAHLLGTGALEKICSALVEAANDAGGRDNISVALVRAGQQSEDVHAAQRSWWSFWR